MTKIDEAFLKRLRETFAVEAAEHCQALSFGLTELAHATEDRKTRVIESMFRSAHSLKGAARAVNLPAVESLCQALESVFSAWTRHGGQPTENAFDTLHRAVDLLGTMTSRLPADAGPDATPPGLPALVKELARIGERGAEPAAGAPAKAAAAPPVPAAPAAARKAPAAPAGPALPPPARASAAATPEPTLPPSGAPPVEAAPETVRVATAKLEQVLYGAEDLVAVKSALAERGLALREALALLGRAAPDGPGDAGDRQEAARLLAEKLNALGRVLEQDHRETSKLVDTLLAETKKLLLLPFGTEQAFFSKLVRDLARDQEKQVDFTVRGAEVELDKRILQEMKAPLVHLLRNAIDHGMERPQARQAAGKPVRGTLVLAATALDGQKIEILVEDDGAGIDLQAVSAAITRRGLVPESEVAALSAEETIAFIFRSQVSTARTLTEVSGRGLGLAIVEEVVDRLGGHVSVRSQSGRGTSFRIVLPVAQATFRGILVSAAERVFVIPAARVDRVQRVRSDAIKTVENRSTIRLDDRAMSFVWLAEVLGLPPAAAEETVAEFVEVVIIGAAERSVAFGVDRVLREEEVLVKPLRKPLCRVRNVSGATVLGSGQVVPILNPGDLLKSAVGASRGARPAAEAKPVPKRAAILVAEDSITSRMLLKNILESAGYRVRTAVDGLDALATLRSEPFELVVSDVEMPRLNGFGLTTAIRADRRLREIPVILVTALASREDRERGIDAGANAYLVKSDFDQGNLLETVRRFV